MTLIISDRSLENPIIWNFGKIDVKFKKPLDPSLINEQNKSPQKEKMEQTFEEVKKKSTFIVNLSL